MSCGCHDAPLCLNNIEDDSFSIPHSVKNNNDSSLFAVVLSLLRQKYVKALLVRTCREDKFRRFSVCVYTGSRVSIVIGESGIVIGE